MATHMDPHYYTAMNTYTVRTADAARAIKALTVASRSIANLTYTVSEARIEVKRAYDIVETRPGCKESVLRSSNPVEVQTFTVNFPTINHNGWSTVAIRQADVMDFATNDIDLIRGAKQFAQSIAPITCQHCAKAIQRNEVYIIHNGVDFMQVGGKCASYYVPLELRKALRAIAVTLSTFDTLTDFEGDRAFGTYNWVNTAVLTHCIDNAKDMEFVPSKGRDGNPNRNATWRRVVEHAQNAFDHNVEAQMNSDVVDLIRTAGLGEDLDAVLEMGEWISRRTAATFVTLYRRAQTAKPSGIEPRHCIPGRQTFTGKVISVKTTDSQWGIVHKMLLELDGGALRLWGSNPSGEFEVGDVVTTTATVEPKELGFGFFSRPAKSFKA